MSFDEDTELALLEPGIYSCFISEKQWVVAGPNGGYLAALLTRAGEAHLGDSTRQLRSLTVHYLRPPKAEGARVEVTTGGSVGRLSANQDDPERQADSSCDRGLGNRARGIRFSRLACSRCRASRGLF